MAGSTGTMNGAIKVVIVGCGLGGLSCAISCRKMGLQVIILERAPKILPIGAGIQVPPNASRVLDYFGLKEELSNYGALEARGRLLRRYADGKILCERPGGDAMIQDFGMPFYVIHRADYLDLLMQEAARLGVELRTNAEVSDVSFDSHPAVTLVDGEKLNASVVVGADGLWSTLRERVLGRSNPPEETGDLAYRGTFSRAQLEALNDDRINELIIENKCHLWMGPEKHCSFYPVKSGREFNLVLLRPDNLPPGARSAVGQVLEVRESFKNWDPVLQKIISCMSSVLKWKLLHMRQLDTWVKGHVALLGDACHPSLPYQAQGAAMAIEDGCVLGLLLGRMAQVLPSGTEVDKQIPSVLQLYESLRKRRTTANVQGSVENRSFFHMPDGSEQQARDTDLSKVDWKGPCKWQWGDIGYLKNLWGFDVVTDAMEAFDRRFPRF